MNQAQARSRLQPAAESLNRVVAADVEDVPDRPAKKGSPGLWAQLCNAPRALGHRAGCNPKYAQTWRVLLLLAAILLVTTGQAYWKSAHGHRSDHGLRQKDFRPHERSAHVPPAVVADAPTPAPAPDPPRVKRRCAQLLLRARLSRRWQLPLLRIACNLFLALSDDTVAGPSTNVAGSRRPPWTKRPHSSRQIRRRCRRAPCRRSAAASRLCSHMKSLVICISVCSSNRQWGTCLFPCPCARLPASLTPTHVLFAASTSSARSQR